MMRVGQPAPDFALDAIAQPGEPITVRLADYRESWLMLLFYPKDFSLVCPTELLALGTRLNEFDSRRCRALGVSCDDLATHERWLATSRDKGGLAGLGFPLASDPDAQAARAYNVYDETVGLALRGLFLIDPDGRVQYAVIHNMSTGRRVDEVIRVLDALQTGGLCPSDWDPTQSLIDPTQALREGSLLSHYRIESQIGVGSFAAVFRARDLTLDRIVALKVMKPVLGTNPSTLVAEARAAAALNHPNVCTLYGVDDSQGAPFLAMEYLDGITLSRTLKNGQLSRADTLSLGRQIAEALRAAHQLGVIHGDLKPENVFITREGTAKVLDFGLARRLHSAFDPHADTSDFTAADASRGIVGTPGYMAPELFDNAAASPASDIFALGCTLHEMATGRRAFPGSRLFEVVDRVRAVDPERLAQKLPAPFDRIILDTLQKRPEDRTSIDAVLDQLRSADES